MSSPRLALVVIHAAGKNIKALVERGEQPHCLRLQKNRVFYVREDLMRRATNVSSSFCAKM